MPRKPKILQKKTVHCTYCGGPIEVSLKAMSVFCPHCQKRVVCESYTIKSYHAVRSVTTCGDVVVEKKGHVVAPIRAQNLVVRGLVRGNILARGRIEIEAGGVVQGNVEAPRLVLHDGAKVVGNCRISRNGKSETSPKRDKAPPPAAERPGGSSVSLTPRSGLRGRSPRISAAQHIRT